MWRSAYNKLLTWKNDPKRKPLVFQGARQVGKTYLVEEFGNKEFAHFVYLNFEQDENLIALFEGTLKPEIIVKNLGLYLGRKIVAENTLLFFDEIQVAPQVLTSLKYFYEQAPEFFVIAAGSLLGVSVGIENSFPVGKVNFLTLYPMSFSEFLLASGEELLVEHLQNIEVLEPLPEFIHNKLTDLFKLYLFLGGMPEVVNDYVINKDIASARRIQNEILEAYQRDFSKYADKNQAVRTSEFWNSIPAQLAKENKKFKYGDIRKGGRSVMYEQTIEWLRKAGLITVVYNMVTPKKPLSAFTDYSKFKVYLHDVGLLAAMLNITSDLIVSPSELFTQFNGAFIENFVAQELLCNGQKQQFYWTSRSDAEVDFVLETDKNIYPVEVKSGTNRNLKSLRSYADKYNPETIFRLSPRNLVQADDFVNFPLYGVEMLLNMIQ